MYLKIKSLIIVIVFLILVSCSTISNNTKQAISNTSVAQSTSTISSNLENSSKVSENTTNSESSSKISENTTSSETSESINQKQYMIYVPDYNVEERITELKALSGKTSDILTDDDLKLILSTSKKDIIDAFDLRMENEFWSSDIHGYGGMKYDEGLLRPVGSGLDGVYVIFIPVEKVLLCFETPTSQNE